MKKILYMAAIIFVLFMIIVSTAEASSCTYSYRGRCIERVRVRRGTSSLFPSRKVQPVKRFIPRTSVQKPIRTKWVGRRPSFRSIRKRASVYSRTGSELENIKARIKRAQDAYNGR